MRRFWSALSVHEGQNVEIYRSAKHFDRDPQTNEVLWFASPPVDVAPSVQKPRHSFAYLNHLAKRRKLELEKEKNTGDSEDAGMDVDREGPSDGTSVGSRPNMSIDEAWQKAVESVGVS